MRLFSCVAKLQLLLGNVRANKEILPTVWEYFKICIRVDSLAFWPVLTKLSFLDQAF